LPKPTRQKSPRTAPVSGDAARASAGRLVNMIGIDMPVEFLCALAAET
jgi:hypothetical protein